MQIFKNPNFNFIKWRWHALALSSIVIVAGLASRCRPGRPAARHRLLGRHHRRPEVRAGRHRGRGARRRWTRHAAARTVVQQYGDAPRPAQILVRLPRGAAGAGQPASSKDAKAVDRRRCTQANLGKFEVVGTEIVGPVIGARPAAQGHLMATLFSHPAASPSTSPSASGSASRSARSWRRCTTSSSRWRSWLLRLRPVAERRRRHPDDHRLLGQRHDRHLRPRAREPPQHAPRLARARREHQRQPDAEPDHHHGRHDVPGGARALPVRRRGAARRSRSRCSSGIISGTYSTVFIAAAIAIILSRKRDQARVPAPPAAEAPGGGRKPNNRKNRSSQA